MPERHATGRAIWSYSVATQRSMRLDMLSPRCHGSSPAHGYGKAKIQPRARQPTKTGLRRH
jgi:hypothetical protein